VPPDSPDRLRALIETLLAALDEDRDGRARARRAGFSRFHLDRLVARGLGEPPAALRRRLVLERAAWRLLRGATATEAGFEAGYGSSAAFARAFSRAHGVAPSRFPASGRDFRIAAPNGVHFHPPAGLLVPGDRGSDAMDPTDRMLEHDRRDTARLLEAAAALTDAELDRDVRPGHRVLVFDGPEPSVRAMLDRLVWTKEVWAAAMDGEEMPPTGERSVVALRSRHAIAGARFIEIVRRVRDRSGWDDAFVDALCDPPQRFTFGSVVAHVLTFAAHRRQVVRGELRDLGLPEVDGACPIEWERAMAAERPLSPARLRGAAS
jgi:AraC family transcriptional regulator